jgi:hypothetical protein
MAEREDTPAEHGSSKVKLKKPRSGLFYFFFSKNKKVKRRKRRRRRRGRSRRRTEHSYIALFFLFLRLVFHVVLESKPWETWQQFPHSHSKLLVVFSSNVQKLKKKKRGGGKRWRRRWAENRQTQMRNIYTQLLIIDK